MIEHLATAFGTTAIGRQRDFLEPIITTYSTTSLIAGAALDRVGRERKACARSAIFHFGDRLPAVCPFRRRGAGYAGRLLSGARGSAFAFTGAVYLASHGFLLSLG